MKKKYKSTKFIIKKLLFNNFIKVNSTFLNILKIFFKFLKLFYFIEMYYLLL